MENSELFRISSDRKIILKKPIILSQINTKEIQLRNDPKNFLHSVSKSFNERQRYLTSKKIKKKDIKGQINLLSDLIDNFSYSSNKNLLLIQKLKNENDYLIDELNRNIKKNTLFNKTTKEIFHELVSKYEKRGYKIPNLTLDNNIFQKSPLLIETKTDVDEFYKNNNYTQGKFIEDLNSFPEKNWNFLKKLKFETDRKVDNNYYNYNDGNKNKKSNEDFYNKKKELNEQIEREKIKKEINKIEILIKKQENEKDELPGYYTSRTNKNNNNMYNKPPKIKIELKDLFKKRLLKNNKVARNSNSLKWLNSENKKSNLVINKKKINKNLMKTVNGFNKLNKNKKIVIGKTLITSLSEKRKNDKQILSYTEQMYNKINKKKLNDLCLIEDDIIQFLKKNNYKINNTNMNNFNRDLADRIYDIKNKVNKQGLSNTFQHCFLTDYGNEGYKKLEKIQDIEKTIEKMDKYLAKHIIDKYFEE